MSPQFLYKWTCGWGKYVQVVIVFSVQDFFKRGIEFWSDLALNIQFITNNFSQSESPGFLICRNITVFLNLNKKWANTKQMKIASRNSNFNYAGKFIEKIDWIYSRLPKPASMNNTIEFSLRKENISLRR